MNFLPKPAVMFTSEGLKIKRQYFDGLGSTVNSFFRQFHQKVFYCVEKADPTVYTTLLTVQILNTACKNILFSVLIRKAHHINFLCRMACLKNEAGVVKQLGSFTEENCVNINIQYYIKSREKHLQTYLLFTLLDN